MTAKALTLAGAILLAGAIEVKADDSYIAVGRNLRDGEQVLINQLKEKLEHITGKQLPLISSSKAAALDDEDDTVITLGEEGLRIVLSGRGKSRVVAAFISSDSFRSVVSDYPNSDRALTAVYSDPDPVKQIALATVLYGQNVGIAFFTSDKESQLAKEYMKAGERMGIAINIQVIDNHHSAKRAFDSIGSARVLVLAKDRGLLEGVGLEKLLYMAYDINNIGVIGYSSGLVRNGALGTTYSSIENIAFGISEVIGERAEDGWIGEYRYSSAFSIALNKYVMRSLLIPELDEKQAAERIEKLIEGGGQ